MNKIKTETIASYTSNNEDSIINNALSIIESRLCRPSDYFTSPDNTKTYCKLKLSLLEHEEFHVLFLDNQHGLIESCAMFRGTIDAASVYPREVVKQALTYNAAAVIFAHNHPSGIAEPSQADKTITDKLKQALSLFDIRVLDHLIVGTSCYSFAEHGLM